MSIKDYTTQQIKEELSAREQPNPEQLYKLAEKYRTGEVNDKVLAYEYLMQTCYGCDYFDNIYNIKEN
jgi:TPR repeat protein